MGEWPLEPVLFKAPAQPSFVNDHVGEVWFYPATEPGGQRRVVVVDYNGVHQQVSYYGGRAFHAGGAVPSWARDAVVEACKHARTEWRLRNVPGELIVTRFTGTDDVPVVQIDTSPGTGRVRINLNESTVFDADPETGV